MLAARMLGTSFPYGTLSANLIGCFLMAVIMETFALQSGLSMQARLFLTTGFAGDIVFTERLLGVLEFSQSKGCVEAFDAMAALDPLQVVPGHGAPTTLERATTDT